MSETKTEYGYGNAVRCEEGEFAGWFHWNHDPYETRSGPFFMRRENDGTYLSAFRAENRHMNGAGFMHGGCLMTFADFALFAIATDELGDDNAVTMNLSGDFLGAVSLGALVEARGEVTRGGGKTIFVRGMVSADGEPALSFTGIIRRISKR
ncbi:PaaI family thioesterase [Erythrobacter sp. THAF29]|uniref:PaaI family thioesterase n=1 Tax=Erythrobacter sp. THAF29 TaxID=2587851 RepID=UPI0012686760|nr:PaaI family thioesterase [Erythrobacter sp. THAF29]QFT77719.1 Thioesterase superfamily protein [Erythrobacter sp. THAF29]